jgi:hypothetical protein
MVVRDIASYFTLLTAQIPVMVVLLSFLCFNNRIMRPEFDPVMTQGHMQERIERIAKYAMAVTAVLSIGGGTFIGVEAYRGHNPLAHAAGPLDVFNDSPPSCPKGPAVVWPSSMDQAKQGVDQMQFTISGSQLSSLQEEVSQSWSSDAIAHVLDEALAPVDMHVKLFELPNTEQAHPKDGQNPSVTQDGKGNVSILYIQQKANELLTALSGTPKAGLEVNHGDDVYLVNNLIVDGSPRDGEYIAQTEDNRRAIILDIDSLNIGDDLWHEALGHGFADRTCQNGILHGDAEIEALNRPGFIYPGGGDKAQNARDEAANNLDTIDSYAATSSVEDIADEVDSMRTRGLFAQTKDCLKTVDAACSKKLLMVRRLAKYIPHFADYIWMITYQK